MAVRRINDSTGLKSATLGVLFTTEPDVITNSLVHQEARNEAILPVIVRELREKTGYINFLDGKWREILNAALARGHPRVFLD